MRGNEKCREEFNVKNKHTILADLLSSILFSIPNNPYLNILF